MRAIVYTRESKGNVASVERQREDGLELAERRDAEVVRVLGDDDLSAAGKRERKDFDELIRLLRDNQNDSQSIDAVIAWSMDRLLRNRRDTVRLIETCQDNNVNLWLVRGSDLDMSTPAGRMMADVLAGQARFEIDVKADRVDRALRQSAEAGKPPRRRAFGYMPDGVTVDPVEGPAVAEAFARLIAGGSIVGIRKSLNERGLHTAACLCPRCAPGRGRPEGMGDDAWTRLRRERGWTDPAVRVLLRNPRYAAIRKFKGVEVGPGTWPPIVSEEVFRAVVAILDDPSRRTTTEPHSRKWLGAALYLCGRCAEQEIVTTMATGYRAPNVNGDKVRLYRCRVSRHVARVADPVDDLVSAVVVERLRRDDLADLLAKQDIDVTPWRTEAAAIRKRREALAKNIDMDERTLAIRDAALAEKLGELESKLAEAGRTSALAAVAGAPDPGAAWFDLDDIGTKQQVVRELYMITLLPGRPGKRGFDASTVRFDPVEHA